MRLINILICLVSCFFLINCSFDNKTGIWINELEEAKDIENRSLKKIRFLEKKEIFENEISFNTLIDMGVPSYLLASTLNLSVAQRLVRILCPNCKEKKVFNNALFPSNYEAPRAISSHYTPVGCDECYYTGYKGRKAVYEVIPIDYELSDAIKNEEYNIREKLEKKGINQLMDNAFDLFEKGETSIDEVYAMLMSNY